MLTFNKLYRLYPQRNPVFENYFTKRYYKGLLWCIIIKWLIKRFELRQTQLRAFFWWTNFCSFLSKNLIIHVINFYLLEIIIKTLDICIHVQFCCIPFIQIIYTSTNQPNTLLKEHVYSSLNIINNRINKQCIFSAKRKNVNLPLDTSQCLRRKVRQMWRPGTYPVVPRGSAWLFAFRPQLYFYS